MDGSSILSGGTNFLLCCGLNLQYHRCMTIPEAAKIVCHLCAGVDAGCQSTPTRVWKGPNSRYPSDLHKNLNSNLTHEFRHRRIGLDCPLPCAAAKLWDTTIELHTWVPEPVVYVKTYSPGNWGHILHQSRPYPDPKFRWCPASDYGVCHTVNGIVSALEPTPEFERSLRLRLTDLTLEDMINVNGTSIFGRFLKTFMGFTFIYEHYNQVEAWKGDVCFYSPLSEKANRFFEQVEEYAAVYLHPSTNLDYSKLPVVNTLNEKLSFYKNIIHRGEQCRCKPWAYVADPQGACDLYASDDKLQWKYLRKAYI